MPNYTAEELTFNFLGLLEEHNLFETYQASMISVLCRFLKGDMTKTTVAQSFIRSVKEENGIEALAASGLHSSASILEIETGYKCRSREELLSVLRLPTNIPNNHSVLQSLIEVALFLMMREQEKLLASGNTLESPKEKVEKSTFEEIEIQTESRNGVDNEIQTDILVEDTPESSSPASVYYSIANSQNSSLSGSDSLILPHPIPVDLVGAKLKHFEENFESKVEQKEDQPSKIDKPLFAAKRLDAFPFSRTVTKLATIVEEEEELSVNEVESKSNETIKEVSGNKTTKTVAFKEDPKVSSTIDDSYDLDDILQTSDGSENEPGLYKSHIKGLHLSDEFVNGLKTVTADKIIGEAGLLEIFNQKEILVAQIAREISTLTEKKLSEEPLKHKQVIDVSKTLKSNQLPISSEDNLASTISKVPILKRDNSSGSRKIQKPKEKKLKAFKSFITDIKASKPVSKQKRKILAQIMIGSEAAIVHDVETLLSGTKEEESHKENELSNTDVAAKNELVDYLLASSVDVSSIHKEEFHGLTNEDPYLFDPEVDVPPPPPPSLKNERIIPSTKSRSRSRSPLKRQFTDEGGLKALNKPAIHKPGILERVSM